MREPYDAAAMREKLAADPLRPGYHFLPPCNWINDPNGLIHLGGQHHLFYQHNPHAATWGNMTWGHAVSSDGLHWQDQPFALEPDHSYDAFGCFSGCAVDDGGTLTLIYTGVRSDEQTGQWQSQCIATSEDGVRFAKHPGNPVIAGPPNGFRPDEFRDPFVWRDDFGNGERWYMVVGAATADEPQRGAILLYEADALEEWHYLGPILTEPVGSPIRMHECPNLFRCGARWVLMTSPPPTGKVVAYVGSFDGRTFEGEHESLIDYGAALYAPLSYIDARGRRLMYGWLREPRDKQTRCAAGWAGALSLPRVLTIGDDGRICQTVADELQTLREAPIALDNLGRMSEVRLTLHVQRTATAELAGTPIVIDRTGGQVEVNGHSAPLVIGDEPVDLRIFIDGSVLEVLVDGQVAFTFRRYDLPKRLVVRVDPGRLGRLVDAQAWQMRSIWGRDEVRVRGQG